MTDSEIDTFVAAVSSRVILRLISETNTKRTYTATEVSELVSQILEDLSSALREDRS